MCMQRLPDEVDAFVSEELRRGIPRAMILKHIEDSYLTNQCAGRKSGPFRQAEGGSRRKYFRLLWCGRWGVGLCDTVILRLDTPYIRCLVRYGGYVRSEYGLGGGQIDVRHAIENTVNNPVHVTHERANFQSHGLQHVSRGGLVGVDTPPGHFPTPHQLASLAFLGCMLPHRPYQWLLYF
jgi:hypothetical protein